MMENAIRRCGLWKQKSAAGQGYLSGSIGGVRMMVFKNTKKNSDGSPDYNVLMVPNEKKPGPPE
jgi:hypothetical protein